jgi:hypothetical protein
MTDDDLKQLPGGVTLGPLSRQVFEVLARYTAFPWPVMTAQAKRVGHDPTQLSPMALRQLIPLLSAGVARFTSPQKGDAARQELEALL